VCAPSRSTPTVLCHDRTHDLLTHCSTCNVLSAGFSFSISESSRENASPMFSPVFAEHSINGIPSSSASANPWAYWTVLHNDGTHNIFTRESILNKRLMIRYLDAKLTVVLLRRTSSRLLFWGQQGGSLSCLRASCLFDESFPVTIWIPPRRQVCNHGRRW
jgi:hypothetical protein